MNTQHPTPHVLIAPLHWGLGHATRCIPIIEAFLKADYQITIASDGAALLLLRKAFPDLAFVTLPAYNIRYGKGNLIWNLALQGPKIAWAIWSEWRFLQQYIIKNNISIVVSDNRLGCFSNQCHNIYITHQLHLQAAWPWLGRVASWLHGLAIRRFNVCWIPDYPKSPNLSGKLSHGQDSFNKKYIGPLSALKVSNTNIEKRYQILVLLSGPEPQRTFLEEIITQQLATLPYTSLLVRGVIHDGTVEYSRHGNMQRIDYLLGDTLSEALCASELIIARTGYSTIMDLARIGAKALLIPTPGQTEQEYLAELLYSQGVCYTQSQQKLDLTTDIPKALTYQGFQVLPTDENLLQDAITAIPKV